MDKLRRFVSGGEGREGHGLAGGPLPTPAPAGKEGGHGDHWGCIFRSVEEATLLELVRGVVESDSRPVGFHARGGGVAYHSHERPVRACVLVEGGRLTSAYPEAVGGTPWPVTLREIVPWANGMEGQLVGECHGADVRFFDTRYYANREWYRVGQEYLFNMSAFAYLVELAPDNEVEIEKGTKVSLKGARAYMPADLSNGSADIDEFWFHSPLEREPGDAIFAGKRLQVFAVTLALPDEFEMSVPLYAAGHTIGSNLAGVGVDDDLEGYLWLQGYLAEDQ